MGIIENNSYRNNVEDVRIHIMYVYCMEKILMGESIDEFDEFSAIRQYFPYQNFSFIQLLTVDEFVVIRLHPK